MTLSEDQTVTMDSRILHPQQNVDTVVHEMLHVCYASTSLPHVFEDKDGEDSHEEIIVDSLAPAVVSLIVDNPELIARIQEEYEKGRSE